MSAEGVKEEAPLPEFKDSTSKKALFNIFLLLTKKRFAEKINSFSDLALSSVVIYINSIRMKFSVATVFTPMERAQMKKRFHLQKKTHEEIRGNSLTSVSENVNKKKKSRVKNDPCVIEGFKSLTCSRSFNFPCTFVL